MKPLYKVIFKESVKFFESFDTARIFVVQSGLSVNNIKAL